MATATILYATQLGNSEEVAKEVSRVAASKEIKVSLHSMSEVGEGFNLSVPGVYVFVLSSTGDGEVPDSARAFLKQLRDTQEGALAGVKYALLGLGDSNYSTYQGGPRTFERILVSLGAVPFLKRGQADEQEGLQKGVETWLQALWDPLEIELRALGTQKVAELRHVSSSKDQPEILAGQVLNRRVLSEPNATKKIVELTIDACGKTYSPGSNISVYPDNDPGAVSEVAARLGLDISDTIIDLRLVPPTLRWRAHVPMTLSDLLLSYVEISTPVTKSFGLFFCDHLTESGEVGELSKILAGVEGRSLPAEWSLLHLLRTYSSFTLKSLEELLPQLPPLRSRFYSISSSPLKCPNSFSIAFGIEGVCTRYLNDVSEHFPTRGIRFSFAIGESVFLPPLISSSKAIFVSTGTGISPFKGILEHLALTNPIPVWVFHGCRQSEKLSPKLNYDFLYEKEVREIVEELGGEVTVTSSRGEGQLRYIQEALRANSQELRAWNQVANICGSFPSKEMKDLLRELAPGIRVTAEEWE